MLWKKLHLLARDVFNLWQRYEKVFKLPKNYGIIFKKSDKNVDMSQAELFAKMWYNCWAKNLTQHPYLLILWMLRCPIHLLPRDEDDKRLRQAKCMALNLFELCQGKQRRTIINNKIEFNLTNENERVRWNRKQTESLTLRANFHIPQS